MVNPVNLSRYIHVPVLYLAPGLSILPFDLNLLLFFSGLHRKVKTL